MGIRSSRVHHRRAGSACVHDDHPLQKRDIVVSAHQVPSRVDKHGALTVRSLLRTHPRNSNPHGSWVVRIVVVERDGEVGAVEQDLVGKLERVMSDSSDSVVVRENVDCV